MVIMHMPTKMKLQEVIEAKAKRQKKLETKET